MPLNQSQNTHDDPSEIKVKIAYSGEVFVVTIAPGLLLEALLQEIRGVCRFDLQQAYTIKWVDEEGDPCTISSQRELDEALRLYDLNKDSEITMHVFPNVPEPGLLCHGEDRSIYRRGARRWRKLYKVNGHIYQAKRFNRRASCAYCQDRIWGLGRQGFKCTQCKLLVHKKCSRLQTRPCATDGLDDTILSSTSTTAAERASGRQRPVTPVSSKGGSRSTSSSLASAAAHAQRQINNADNSEEAVVELPPGEQNVPAPASTGQYCLDDFTLLRVIGRGSYAKVLMVELKRTSRIYAMKVIKKTLVTDDEDIDWVQTEKHVFETASNHPFLVGLHSCFQTPSRLFFVIEFVRGGDLMFHMQRQRRLHEEHARFYSAEICLALNFLHERGIIYRDLKLDNVLLDHEGHIKLTDYGMCKEGIRPGDTTSTFCGTPNYIAPEILQGAEYSFSVDWWALGVLLYEMLAGKSPFDIVGSSDNPDFNTEDFLFQVILERPIRIPRSLSVRAASILRGFLNKNPTDRLGCHPEQGFSNIVSHAFFRTINWELLEQRQVQPPYKPPLRSDRDLTNFPPEFTEEVTQLTPDQQRDIDNIDQSEFEGFEYVNPLLMSMEDCV